MARGAWSIATAGRLALAALLLSPLLVIATPAAAQTRQSQEERRQEELRRVEREMQEQRARRQALEREGKELDRELDELKAQMVVAGRSARTNEIALSALEEALSGLESEARAKHAALGERRREIGSLLGALQRVAIHPPEAMLALPQPPRDTVRSVMLLSTTLPRLDEQAREIKGEIAELARVEADIRRQRALVQSATGKLTDERRTLERLAQRKSDLERRNAVEQKRTAERVEKLAVSARDLKELIDRLQAQRRAEEARRAEALRLAEEARRREEEQRAADALRRPGPPDGREVVLGPRGARTLPAAGKMLAGYGQQNDLGITNRGISIETRAGATVVSPYAGRVMFAGNFRGYGLILIIEHGDGYHSLIAGLGRIDSDVGQTLATGEPIGVMGASAERNPTLYFELRRNGQPVNPQPWLTAERAR